MPNRVLYSFKVIITRISDACAPTMGIAMATMTNTYTILLSLYGYFVTRYAVINGIIVLINPQPSTYSTVFNNISGTYTVIGIPLLVVVGTEKFLSTYSRLVKSHSVGKPNLFLRKSSYVLKEDSKPQPIINK